MNKDLFFSLDLNLLRTFRVLSQERNMRKASQRLFVSQPAISQALQKLRHHFDDELFVKVHGGLEPTPFAIDLANAIAPHLDGLAAQYNLPQVPMLGFQLEIGGVKYEGSRYYFWNKPTEYREGSGVSMAAAWVLAVNDNLALRAGMDVNYIDSDKTYLSSNFSTTLNTGIVLRF